MPDRHPGALVFANEVTAALTQSAGRTSRARHKCRRVDGLQQLLDVVLFVLFQSVFDHGIGPSVRPSAGSWPAADVAVDGPR